MVTYRTIQPSFFSPQNLPNSVIHSSSLKPCCGEMKVVSILRKEATWQRNDTCGEILFLFHAFLTLSMGFSATTLHFTAVSRSNQPPVWSVSNIPGSSLPGWYPRKESLELPDTPRQEIGPTGPTFHGPKKPWVSNSWIAIFWKGSVGKVQTSIFDGLFGVDVTHL